MESNISTVTFRSNLYPVEKNFNEDSNFRSKIHDPFSLELLKKQFALTSLQKKNTIMHRYTAHTLQKKTTLGEQSETSRAMIRSFADVLIQNAASFIVAVLTLIPPNWQ